MKYLYIILCILSSLSLYSQHDTTGDPESRFYQEDKLISMDIRKRFDPKFPVDVNDYYFYQGNKQISQQDLARITGDDLLIKNEARIKKVRKGGIAGAIALGSISTLLLIPSVSFIVVQTNWHRFPALTSQYDSYYEYWEETYNTVVVPGIVTSLLTMLCTLGVLVDLIVMFSLINKYKNNTKIYKRAIDKYNKQVKQKYVPRPDLGFSGGGESSEGLSLSLKINI